jgi:hypothetical protein
MSYNEFLEDGEKVKAKFEYHKKMTQEDSVLAVTDKRAFYYHKDNIFLLKKKKSETFLSSKFPIPTIKYKLWTAPIWGWVLNILGYIIAILFFLINASTASSEAAGPLFIGFLIACIYLSISTIILIIYRKVIRLTAVIGKEDVIIQSRKENVRDDAKDFIKKLHAITSIRESRTSESLGVFGRKLFLTIILLIYIVVFIVMFFLIFPSIAGLPLPGS